MKQNISLTFLVALTKSIFRFIINKPIPNSQKNFNKFERNAIKENLIVFTIIPKISYLKHQTVSSQLVDTVQLVYIHI